MARLAEPRLYARLGDPRLYERSVDPRVEIFLDAILSLKDILDGESRPSLLMGDIGGSEGSEWLSQNNFENSCLNSTLVVFALRTALLSNASVSQVLTLTL